MNASKFQGGTNSALPGILTHSTRQGSAGTIPWTLGTRALRCTARFALTTYPGVSARPVVPMAKQENILIDTRQLTIPT